jgi:hypothetical protein
MEMQQLFEGSKPKQKLPWPCNDGGGSYLNSRMLGVEGITICHLKGLKKTE